jgi:hypothetical protein
MQHYCRMQHYCPIHPKAVEAITPLLEGRDDNEHIFKQLSFERLLRLCKIRRVNGDTWFHIGDLRKFMEQ